MSVYVGTDRRALSLNSFEVMRVLASGIINIEAKGIMSQENSVAKRIMSQGNNVAKGIV